MIIPQKFVIGAVVFAVIALCAFGAGWRWSNNDWQAKWDKREAEYAKLEKEAAQNALAKQTELQQEVNNVAEEFTKTKSKLERDLASALARNPTIIVRKQRCDDKATAAVPEGGGGRSTDGATSGEGLSGGTDVVVRTDTMKLNAAECNVLRAQVVGLQQAIRKMQGE